MPANNANVASDGDVDGRNEGEGVVDATVNDSPVVEPEASGSLDANVIGETVSVPGPVKEGQHQGVAVEERARLESSSEAAGSAKARATLQRARAVARGAMDEKVAPRVEKLRQTSSVVLDEAADDPSLRFVLIAVVIFILFLALFFISKLLG
jgi:hypothetical protein